MEKSDMTRALRTRVPAKITSCMLPPRRLSALCSPRSQLTPSRKFDFPHPFGPTTTAIPVPGTVSSVRSQKLLKPRMWIFFSFSMLSPGQQDTNGNRSQQRGTTIPGKLMLPGWSTGADFTPEGESEAPARRGVHESLFDYRL